MPNTDNKGHLFVTVFICFTPTILTAYYSEIKSNPAIVLLIKKNLYSMFSLFSFDN